MTQTLPTEVPPEELIEPALRSVLGRLDSTTRLVCGYHLGLWDAAGGPGGGNGKGIRPLLAVLSAQAAGADPVDAVPAAVACELVHNFSLLHDDVMDGDLERRHRPTVWAVYGSSTAVLAGDALLALANEVLAEADSPNVAWALRCLGATTRRLIAGQTADLAFESRHDVDMGECLAMASDKTGALLSCSASLGAVLVDAPSELGLGLAEYGEHLGLAFQLVDDLLGIWGSTERTGKPVWSDLRARKKSLPVVAALTSSSGPGDRLRAIYADDTPLAESVLEEAACLIQRAGGRQWAEGAAERESQAALATLERLCLPEPVHHRLVALTDTLSRRDY